MNDSFSSTYELFELSCALKEVFFIIIFYITPIISGIGIFLNLYNALIFYQILKESSFGHMFKYLLFKCIDDAIQFIIQVFAPFYYCNNCDNIHSYNVVVWFIWFNWYLGTVFEFGSTSMEILATFDCYITINKHLKCFRSKHLPYILNVIIHVYAFVYHIYIPYISEIVPLKLVNGETFYILSKTRFYKTRIAFTLSIMATFLKDISAFVLLLIFNSLLLITLKRSMKKKMKIMIQNDNKKVKNFDFIQKANRNNTILIFFSSINFMMGHILLILINLPIENAGDIYSCAKQISSLLYFLSSFSSFFLYYSFNKQFRKKARININRVYSACCFKSFKITICENSCLSNKYSI